MAIDPDAGTRWWTRALERAGNASSGTGRIPDPELRRANAVVAFTVGTLVVAVVGTGLAVARVTAPIAHTVQAEARWARELVARPQDFDVRSKIFDRSGRLVAVLHGEQNREPVALGRIPRVVRDAVLAAEDHRFYRHDGVDVVALGRAFLSNAKAAEVREGGGTITMQLARIGYLRDRRKTVNRKVSEIVVARRLEETQAKDRILEMYLNTVYFGEGAYGIQAAAETYFRRPLARLTVAQAALLAGVIRAPEALNPRRDPRASLARRNRVLGRMRDLGMIDARVHRSARRAPLRLAPRRVSNGVLLVGGAGGSFVEFVKQQLLGDRRLGRTPAARARRLFEGGLRIKTTLDLDAQRAAERTVREVLDRRGDPSAAVVAVDPGTGDIRAMAGGRDARGFNLAEQGRRQPGSAFKPFTLIAGLERNISVYRQYDAAEPRVIPLGGAAPWVVHNYEGSPSGPMSLLDATRHSVNVVYAQLVMQVGARAVVETAHRMGIESVLHAYPSISLGALEVGVSPLEMSVAYATIANGGMRMRPRAVVSVEDRDARTVLREGVQGTRALDEEIAWRAAAVLREVVLRGTGRRAQRLGHPAGGKTGTTDDYRDSWFVGFTRQLSAAVWMGYPKVSRPLRNIHGMERVFGGSLPAEIWTRFMIAAHQGLPVLGFPAVDIGEGDRGPVLHGDHEDDEPGDEAKPSSSPSSPPADEPAPSGRGRKKGRKR